MFLQEIIRFALLRVWCRFDTTQRMRARIIFTALALLLAVALPALAEPKAYDLVKYRGKAEGLTIAFDYGDGYPEASEVRIKQARGGKSMRFALVDDSKLRFVPEKKRGSGDEVTLEMEPLDEPPDKVKGTYRAGGKTIRFTVARQE